MKWHLYCSDGGVQNTRLPFPINLVINEQPGFVVLPVGCW